MKQLLTRELANQIEKSEIAVLRSRLLGIHKQTGNPMDVEVRQFGNATAFSVKGIPGPSYNTVKGIIGEDVGVIDDILDFYKERNISARFEITPAACTPKLFQVLQENGFYHSGFHTALYGWEEDLNMIDIPTISIRNLGENEFDVFADQYVRGFSMPVFLKVPIAQNNQVLNADDSWHFYLASIDDQPAGIGVLFTENGIGTLAVSTTAPEFRNKGVHRALISRRIEDAVQLGCDYVVGQASFGSTSQCNMERSGMKVAYTKAIWVKKGD